jgi:hypothetical protein
VQPFGDLDRVSRRVAGDVGLAGRVHSRYAPVGSRWAWP